MNIHKIGYSILYYHKIAIISHFKLKIDLLSKNALTIQSFEGKKVFPTIC